MTDILTINNPGELVLDYHLNSNGQFDNHHDLVTAVILSLFTDRRAEDYDQLPFGEDDKRGCWSDLDGEALYNLDRQGSRLWLLKREKALQEVRVKAEFYIREALDWMVDQRIVSSIDVETNLVNRPPLTALFASITLLRIAQDPIQLRFQPLWDDLKIAA